jgi:F-type H+-transporting ATPase subunit epsilon
MLLDVSVLTPKEVIFEGTAKAVTLPGEEGVFEILPYHKSIVSRLVSGNLFIDNEKFFIKRGVMKLHNNKVVVIVEQK